MNEFSTELRRARKDEGRTQKEMAEAMGLSEPYVSNVERGGRPPFTHKRIMDVASYLGRDPASLLIASWRTRGVIPVEFAGDLQDCAVRAIEADWARRDTEDQGG